ncbi:MAG: DUF2179 domain-containing protein [Anaerolineae bacterium]|nr:DUF2179 domain-containing protein [Anaerolineae bacterium]
METGVLLTAGGIFLLRVVGNMLTTLRLIVLVRGEKLRSSALAIFETLVFAIALGNVVNNLNNGWNLTAYCLGYAVGGYLGMTLEQRLIKRFVAVDIISAHHAHVIALAVREAGYGATEGWGEGAQGSRGTVRVVTGNQDAKLVVQIVQRIDPEAFVTVDELRSITRGYIRFARPER